MHHPTEDSSGESFTCPMHPEVVSDKKGRCPVCGMDLVPSEKTDHKKIHHDNDHHQFHKIHSSAVPAKEHIGLASGFQKYTCPMHPHIVKNAPGQCPQCGMDLVPMQGGDAHGSHKGGMNEFRRRFWIVLLLTIPVLALSTMIQHWLGFTLEFPGRPYVLLILSSIVFFYGGWPFLRGLKDELQRSNPGMMTLIGFAISVAYIYSTATVFGLEGMDFFWELATLILVMLLGHYIEMKSVAGASRELELLVQMLPDEAHLIEGKSIHDVRTSELKKDDVILIKPGEKIAADGIIIEGESFVNESMLTGESVPVKKQPGNALIAGALNQQGALHIRVSHSLQDSYLAQVIHLVQEAQQSKSKTQLMADKAARWLTIIALVSGVTTFLVWYLGDQSLSFSIERMVTVIVICCPHALGLAVPLVVARSTSLSARHGLLIKNRTDFENARKITTVVFDKTGTLTVGKFEVSDIVAFDENISSDELLAFAAALEQNSEHPIATGIIQKAKDLHLIVPKAQGFQAITGKGIEAMVGDRPVKVVSPGFLSELHIELPSGKSPAGNETVVYILLDDKLAGYIALSDTIREESASAIKALDRMGIRSVLLTGDNRKVAESVAGKLGLSKFYAEVLPHQKLEKIKEMQEAGEYVAMTGDGVNDAPALAQADIGIAVGSGSDIATETSGIVLVQSNPRDVVNLILFGKATYRKMIQNLVWATGYNVIALPLAAGVLYHQGILLSPAIGAALMSISTIVVAINAGSLRVRPEL